jgi:ABC-type uncharacterized transport system permease subunit
MPYKIPSTGQIALLLLAVAIFVVGGTVSLARIWRDRNSLRLTAKACIYWGILAALGALIWHSVDQGSWVPLEDNFAVFTTLGVLLAGFVLYMQRWRPIGGLDWFIMPIAVLMLISAAVFGKFRPDVYKPENTWEWVHHLSSYAGAAAFAIAAAVGMMYLVVSARLRRKTLSPGPNMGSLERLERVTQASASLGFALLTLGMITGLVEVLHDPHNKLGSHWMTSPKVLLAFCVWVVYAMALHTPITPSVRGRKSAVLSIVGFVLMFGTLIVVQFMPEGR